MSLGYAKIKARKILKRYGTNSLKRILKEKGYLLVFEYLGDNIMGYCTTDSRVTVIHVNDRLSWFEQMLVIAHELGHCILHPKINTQFMRKNTLFSVDKIEHEASSFAIHLIVGFNEPEIGETQCCFLLRCGIPEEYHKFY